MLAVSICILTFFLPTILANSCNLDPSRFNTNVYNWSVFYTKANPDGYFRRMIYIVDNNVGDDFSRLAGPTIRVCKGDKIIVHLENRLQAESISIHWHGQPQRGTPWMDGVQQISQYPILPTQKFRYEFTADTVGTYWYHSHTGGQYTDGLLGMLIVDDPLDPYKDYPEYTMLLREWYHNQVEDAFDIFMNYPTTRYNPLAPFVTGLINDKGRYNCTPEEMNRPKDNCTQGAPFARFKVSQNRTYRFRIVSAGSQFTYRFSIDQHSLTIVAMDGVYVEPYIVHEMFIDIGQRYDILVNMSEAAALYWIRVFTSNNRFDDEVHQFNAILQYDGASDIDDPRSTYVMRDSILIGSKHLNPDNNNRLDIPLKPPAEFNIGNSANSSFKTARIVYLNITCNDDETQKLDHCFMNNVSYTMPPKVALLSLKENESPSIPTVELSYNEHVIFIINNFVTITHPLHIHGHDFYVLGSGPDVNVSGVTPFDISKDWQTFDLESPPIRDTFRVPRHSWVAVGFIANNPGSWLIHCHITFDMESGMARLLNVHGPIPDPPKDYPIIGGYEKSDPPIPSAAIPTQSTMAWKCVLLVAVLFFQIGY